MALYSLVTNLATQAWHPSVILGQAGPLVPRLEEAGVPVSVRPLPTKLTAVRQDRLRARRIMDPLQAAAGIVYAVELSRYFRRQRFDLVATNSMRAALLGGIAARLAGIPCIWHVHSIASPPAMAEAASHLVCVLGGWLPDHIICNSVASARCFGGRSDRVSVIPPAVDSAGFAPNGHAPRPKSRVGMIARFSPLKGQHVFTAAATQLARFHPDAEFVLAGTALFGEEAYEQRIREQVRTSDAADQIRFLGFVNDVPALVRECDVLVSASTLPEGFGLAVVEAMMAGKPVIASAIGGTAEVIEDEVTGRLVPPGDSIALAAAISHLITHPAEAAEMGRRAREVALEKYDIRKTTHAVEAVYQRVLAQA